MKTILTLSIAALFLTGCKKETTKPDVKSPEKVAEARLISRAEWLIGRWENQAQEGHLIEEWKKENDSVFKGYSVVIVGKDTVFSEQMSLEEKPGKLDFIVSVKGQNQELPVTFSLELERNDKLRFVNPEHEKPSVIEYRNPQPDSLVATIFDNHGKPMETFRMKKTK